jgi:hypothetical protein
MIARDYSNTYHTSRPIPTMLADLTLRNLRDLRVVPGHFLEGAKSVDLSLRIGGSSHSNVHYGILLDGDGERLRRRGKPSDFVIKEYFKPNDPSQFYKDGRDAHKLWAREYQANALISGSVGQKLVARPMGKSLRGGLYSAFWHIKHPCAYDLILNDIKNNDPESKEHHLSTVFKAVANFGGRVHSHQEYARFPSHLFDGIVTNETKYNQIIDDLAIIIYERHKALGEDVPINARGLERFVQDKYDFSITEFVSEIVTLCYEVEAVKAYQHGDLRLPHTLLDINHIINLLNVEKQATFLDLEQFGERIDGRDLVTILTTEGGIAMPKPEDLPAVIGDFLIYRGASTILNRHDRRSALFNLDGMTPQERRNSSYFQFSQDEYAKFLSQVLSLGVRESLHLQATNERSTPEQRAARREGIPNYSDEDMLTARYSQITDFMEIAADSRRMVFGILPHDDAIGTLFQRWTDLFSQLDLITKDESLYKRLN